MKINNEIELCRVNDEKLRTVVEKALLAERISFFIKWEKASFFSDRQANCIFCINRSQAETAEKAIRNLGNEVESKIKFIYEKN